MGSKSIPMALINLSCKGFRMQQKRGRGKEIQH